MRMFSLVRIFLGEENASLSGNDVAPGCPQQTNLYTPWGGSQKSLALRRFTYLRPQCVRRVCLFRTARIKRFSPDIETCYQADLRTGSGSTVSTNRAASFAIMISRLSRALEADHKLSNSPGSFSRS